MDKIKRYNIPKSYNERIGIDTGLLDKNKKSIFTGDNVKIHNYTGIVLWHREYESYGLFFGLSNLFKDKYDYKSYGKFIKIPKDNGMRMEIEII